MPIIIDKRAKNKNGLSRYRVRVNYTDTNGVARQVERLAWGKSEAENVERQLEAEYKDKRVVPSARMTVEELYNKYDKYHATETRKSTHTTTMKRLRLWVLPYFKNKRLDKLTQQDFADWKVKISGTDLELSTRQNIFKTFVAMLNYAVSMEFIPKNGLSALGNFKDNEALEKPTKPFHYYTSSQFEQFIAVAKGDCKTTKDWDFYVFFCVAFFTGARKGEINALRWSDIEGNILHIRRSITQKLEGGDLETAPKNKSSVRDLQLPLPLIAVLNEHKQRQRETAQDLFREDFRICGGKIPLRDSPIDKRNRKYAKAAELPRIKIHEYRHPYVKYKTKNILKIFKIFLSYGLEERTRQIFQLYPVIGENVNTFYQQVNK